MLNKNLCKKRFYFKNMFPLVFNKKFFLMNTHAARFCHKSNRKNDYTQTQSLYKLLIERMTIPKPPSLYKLFIERMTIPKPKVFINC